MTIAYTAEEVAAISAESNFKLDSGGRLLLFVGHAHSGHSLIGALIDAHPAVCLANEVNIVKLIREQQLEKETIERVLYYSYQNNTIGWKNSAYQYDLEYGSQGKSSQPEVIGDKKAGGSTRILHNHPKILKKLLEFYGSRLRFIFVERNPLDIIAAYSYYMKQPPSEFHVNRYNENLKTVGWIKKQVLTKQWLTIRQDNFVQRPLDELCSAFDFLGVDINVMDDYIEKLVSVVRSDIPGKSESIHINSYLKAKISTLDNI